jgi:hypothetical protein
MRSDEDAAVAVELQIDDACEVVKEWVREDSDYKLAMSLTSQLDEEDRRLAKMNIQKGEEEALKIAIEERNRLKQRREEREILEKQDALLARKLVLEEEEKYFQAKQTMEDDEKYIASLMEGIAEADCKDSKSTGRKISLLTEFGDDKHHNCLEEKDGSLDSAQKRTMIFADSKNVFNDEGEEKSEVAPIHPRCQRPAAIDEEGSAEVDAALSRKRSVKKSRALFVADKAAQAMLKADAFPTEAAVARQWELAEVTIEDVCDGICITVTLPNLAKLKCRVIENSRKIMIEAERLLFSSGFGVDSAPIKPTEENSQYNAEFSLNGRNVRLTAENIQYEYSSETGLLHVFIDNVYLDDQAANKAFSSGVIGGFISRFGRLFGK